jgi:hypothetical protein
MNKKVTHPAYYIFRFTINHDHHFFIYIYTYLVAIPCSTSRICPSWPCPRVGLSPSLAHTYHVSSLFVLAHQVACCLSQRFIFHTYNPPLTIRRCNTFIKVNIMGAQYNIYNRHIHRLQLFFLCFCLTSGQASWPQTFMSGTVTWFAILSLTFMYNAWTHSLLQLRFASKSIHWNSLLQQVGFNQTFYISKQCWASHTRVTHQPTHLLHRLRQQAVHGRWGPPGPLTQLCSVPSKCRDKMKLG